MKTFKQFKEEKLEELGPADFKGGRPASQVFKKTVSKPQKKQVNASANPNRGGVNIGARG
jgi:hypothetical protein